MGILEYRTMRLRVRGAHMGGRERGPRARATGGADTGCPRGDPGALLANPGARLLAKEGGPVNSDKEGIDGQLLRQAASGTRKEGSGKRHDRGIGANKRPLGASKGLW